MSNIFGAAVDTSAAQRNEERVGGGGFTPLDPNVYEGKVKMAYCLPNKDAASQSLAVVLECDFDGKPYSETLYVRNKKGAVTYEDKNGVARLMPGFQLLDDIITIATSGAKSLNTATPIDKTIELYDRAAGKKLPTTVKVLDELTGAPIVAAIGQEIRYAQENDGNGNYSDVNMIVKRNNIKAVFIPANNKTITEARANKEATFRDEWLKANEGKPYDSTKGKPTPPEPSSKDGKAPTPAAAAQSSTGIFG